MNKKQAIIIVTLLVLIVCAGVVAAKMNDNTLYGNSSDISNGKSAISSLNNSDKKSTTDYFSEQKLQRDTENTKTLQTLKSIIDDPNSTKENKLTAGQKYNQITEENFNEGKIESILKSKGYTDVVCIINDNKAKVIVKTKTQITQKQAKEISEVVNTVANIDPAYIETENRQ